MLIAGVLGTGLLLHLSFPIQELLKAEGESGPAAYAVRYLWILALGVFWAKGLWHAGSRLPALDRPVVALATWLCVVTGGTAALLLAGRYAEGIAFALQWGAWVGIALTVAQSVRPEERLRLLQVSFLGLGLLALAPIAYEHLFDLQLLKRPTTVGDVTRHFGLNNSITVAGFEVAVAAVMAMHLLFSAPTRSMRLVSGAVLGLLAAGLPLTTSRVAVIAFPLSAALMLFFMAGTRRQLWPRLLAIGATLAVMTVSCLTLVPAFAPHLLKAFSLQDAGNVQRLEVMTAAMADAPPATDSPNRVVPHPAAAPAIEVPPTPVAASPGRPGFASVPDLLDEVRRLMRRGYETESSVLRLYRQGGPAVLAGAIVFASYLLMIIVRTAREDRGVLLGLFLLIATFSTVFDLLKSWIGLFYAFSSIGVTLSYAARKWRPAANDQAPPQSRSAA